MKKKVIAIWMTMVMMTSAAAGCGGKNEATADVTPSAPQVTTDIAGKTSADDTQSYSPARQEKQENDRVAEVNYAEAADMAVGVAADSAMGILPGGCYVPVPGDGDYEEIIHNTEEYSTLEENPFRSVSLSPLSTFSADVDTASYSNVRRMLRDGYRPSEIPSGAVRTEEMLNYFTYDYAGPKGAEPFGVTAVLGKCPWNKDAELLTLGLQTEAIDFSDAPDSNLVFLIDVSGSMYSDDKLPLLKKAFEMLVENLGEKDRVSIVTYASRDEIVLDGTPGNDKNVILKALDGLEAGGSTNGGAGIITAYELAAKYFIEGGNNRVILATDGDLNVGITSESQLHDLIEKKREKGIFLSVLGFGSGNYSDTNMETLADYGNGNYAYIDSISEAKKVLVEEMGSTLVTVAKDVKLQIEFNPAVVAEYRLIGYENRTMAAEDFENDKKDAGEIGAGHSVTAVYEIITVDKAARKDKELKYQDITLSDAALENNEWMTLSIRYKEPDGDTSKLVEYPIGATNYREEPSDDFLFAAAVAEFSMLLKDSDYVKDGSYQQVLGLLGNIRLNDEYKKEFYNMVDAARISAEW